MIFNRTSRARVQEAERLWIAKFVLRLLAIICAIIAFGLAGGVWNRTPALQYRYSYFNFWLFLLAAPLALSLIWNIANIIVRLSRPRPMHPGANVGMDLIIWLAFVPMLVFVYAASVSGLHYRYAFYGCYNADTSSCSSSDYASLAAQVRYWAGLEVAAAAFSTIALLLHFALFVWACVDTARRNQASVDVRAAAIASSMVTDMQKRGLFVQVPQEEPYNATNGAPHGHMDSYYGPSTEAESNHYDSRKQSGGPMGIEKNTASPTAPHPAHVS